MDLPVIFARLLSIVTVILHGRDIILKTINHEQIYRDYLSYYLSIVLRKKLKNIDRNFSIADINI